jgi:hypothetical protein
VTFTSAGGGAVPLGAVGLRKVAGEHVAFDASRGTLTVWQAMEKKLGMQGLAVVADPARVAGDTADAKNNLMLLHTGARQVMEYWAGFAWDRAGKIPSEGAWQRYVREFADGVRTPIVVTVAAP